MYRRHNIPVPDGFVLPPGWVLNVVKVPVAPALSSRPRLEYIQRQWRDLPFEQRADPFYSISAPYWDAVIDAEHEARRGSFFLPRGMHEPPPEWFHSDEERERVSSDPEIPDFPLPAPAPAAPAPAEEEDSSDGDWGEPEWEGIQATIEASLRHR